MLVDAKCRSSVNKNNSRTTNMFRRICGRNLNGFFLCVFYLIVFFNASERVRWQCFRFAENKHVCVCVCRFVVKFKISVNYMKNEYNSRKRD